jgi:hypothetical protein
MITPFISKEMTRKIFIASNVLESLFDLHSSGENAEKVETYMPPDMLIHYEFYSIILKVIIWTNLEMPTKFIKQCAEVHTRVGDIYSTNMPIMLKIFNEVIYKFERAIDTEDDCII